MTQLRKQGRLARLKESVRSAASPRSSSTPSSPVLGSQHRQQDPSVAGAGAEGPSVREIAERELQDKMYRLLLLPLCPQHVDLVPVEDRPLVGTPREGSVEAASTLRRRIDAIEAQSTELQNLCAKYQTKAAPPESSGSVLEEQAEAYELESGQLHKQLDEMSVLLEPVSYTHLTLPTKRIV
eukprot:TRINITY_DN21614_c0_g1_i2.p1 TRINITY_DN21614_c0_g1~~TRINITY_DN21614_c0_g1_i2.p1  ORF type:complete len:182 (+),score=28.16 TRINITY_DN21614_c0_g1_i2:177-722(+)